MKWKERATPGLCSARWPGGAVLTWWEGGGWVGWGREAGWDVGFGEASLRRLWEVRKGYLAGGGGVSLSLG